MQKMEASDKDRQYIERCCNLIVRGTRMELHGQATSVDVAAAKETVAFAIQSIVDHVAWARADERLKAELSAWWDGEIFHYSHLRYRKAGLEFMGYLGVRREAEEPIVARVTLRDGGEHKPPAKCWLPDTDDDKYAEAELHSDAFNWRHAKEHGIEIMVDGDTIGRATYWEDSGDSSVGIAACGGWELQGGEYRELCKKANNVEDTAAIAAQALAEWRSVKQQPKAADWAYRWAVDLCERLGAK